VCVNVQTLTKFFLILILFPFHGDLGSGKENITMTQLDVWGGQYNTEPFYIGSLAAEGKKNNTFVDALFNPGLYLSFGIHRYDSNHHYRPLANSNQDA
jgi:hypothetical protein